MNYAITKHSSGTVFSSSPEEALAAANREAAERAHNGWTLVNGSTSADQYGVWTIFMFWQREALT